jgi:BirA family transcriptional regulator, biotin operon repressor / biotin---[acetyl-CoA-carboxylase] ligase
VLPAPHPELSERLGRSCWYRPVTGSTNDDAAGLAEQGAPHGSLVMADHQTAGRGRVGRSWYSPPDHNLYFSLILRPATAPADTALLTLAAGVAIAEVLELQIKWPNDVVAPGFRKVAGLLCEMDVSQGRVVSVVLGVGINVNQPDFPPDLPLAASLRTLGGEPVERYGLLARLLPVLEHRIQQIEGDRQAIVCAWSALSATTGQRVRVGDLEGVATGLRADGALLLRLDDGREYPVVAGDVWPT